MSLLVEEPLAPTLVDIELPDPPCLAPQAAQPRTSLKDRAVAGFSSLAGACLGPREKQAFGILRYHRVCEPPEGAPPPTWYVTPERFEQQLTGLIARGWQAWPLRQVISCMERDLPIPRKTFVITFDDGYVNNLIEAAPILTTLHLPATLFLATKYLDSKQPFPCDDWTAAGQPGVPSESWRPLTTEECRRLCGNGLIELGAHTHTHADFRNRPDALRSDLAENIAVLEERFNVILPAFAFPYGTKAAGFVTPELIQAARDAGAICSLTAESGLVRPGDSPFGWGRFTVREYDTAASLAAKLGGWHSALGTKA
jgi:peptidoglycan/xylan/chitin deacetylase (PgdA/CDA1 family)